MVEAPVSYAVECCVMVIHTRANVYDLVGSNPGQGQRAGHHGCHTLNDYFVLDRAATGSKIATDCAL